MFLLSRQRQAASSAQAEGSLCEVQSPEHCELSWVGLAQALLQAGATLRFAGPDGWVQAAAGRTADSCRAALACQLRTR